MESKELGCKEAVALNTRHSIHAEEALADPKLQSWCSN